MIVLVKGTIMRPGIAHYHPSTYNIHKMLFQTQVSKRKKCIGQL